MDPDRIVKQTIPMLDGDRLDHERVGRRSPRRAVAGFRSRLSPLPEVGRTAFINREAVIQQPVDTQGIGRVAGHHLYRLPAAAPTEEGATKCDRNQLFHTCVPNHETDLMHR